MDGAAQLTSAGITVSRHGEHRSGDFPLGSSYTRSGREKNMVRRPIKERYAMNGDSAGLESVEGTGLRIGARVTWLPEKGN